ncbi:NUDIX domain-containing protein [Nonomuraea sp. 3N208]|uniref:NUDIX domain-containing protein n=1 Tax=Nonomuraea sp. 3N208 TaxID=3457421 RepID=UPI003FD07454
MTAGHCVEPNGLSFGDVVWTNWRAGVGTIGLPGHTTTYGDLALMKVGHPPATIGRIRPGHAFYSVLPGGGVEDSDRSLEAALLREIEEELGGQAVIHSLIHIDGSVPGQRQYIFLARIDAWDIGARSGPEFNDPARGQYLLQTTPLTRDAVAGLNLLPDAVAVLLAGHVRVLFAMADLRG